MAKAQIDRWLRELAEADGSEHRHMHVLERASAVLLNRPALGRHLITRLCATPDGSPDAERLVHLLGVSLVDARIARDSGVRHGQRLIDALTDTLEQAANEQDLSPMRRTLLAGIWNRSGLAVPPWLPPLHMEFGREPDFEVWPTQEGRDGTESIAHLFQNLVEQADGNVLELREILSDVLASIAMELRIAFIEWVVGQPGDLHGDLACYWLLNPDVPIRGVAAEALVSRAKTHGLSSRLAAKLVMLRAWMPEDAAQDAVDQAIRAGMRAGITPAPPSRKRPPVLESAVASLPDGTGSQTICLVAKSGRRRSTALLLLKLGEGITDAFTLVGAAADQRAAIQEFQRQGGLRDVPVAWVSHALAQALAEGLSFDRPPAPGFLDVAEEFGFGDLGPARGSTDATIERVAAPHGIASLPTRARTRLLKAAADWGGPHPMVQTWFETDPTVDRILAQASSEHEANAALWAWLETRRGRWTSLLARAADVMAAADDPDAASFAATAWALASGMDLKKIPIMVHIHEDTIQAWLFENEDGDEDEDEYEDGDEDVLTELLEEAPIGPPWIDGFLTSIVIAPKMLKPNEWLSALLERILPHVDRAELETVMQLIMGRQNACVHAAQDPTRFVATLDAWHADEAREWAEGFSEGHALFPKAWPVKRVSKEDRALLARIGEAARKGSLGLQPRLLATWIHGRYERSIRG